MKKILVGIGIGLLLLGCATSKKSIRKTTDSIITSPFYDSQFTGFVLFDPEAKDTIYNLNGSRYFTPASNTKIFTLFASLQLLPDRIPALKYVTLNDTLFLEGTGDPSFLHPYFKDTTALHFIEAHRNVALYLNNFQDDKFGPGWSWGDYQYYYQPERSAFPLYGNVVRLYNSNTMNIEPIYFKDSIVPINYSKNRELERNVFYYSNSRRDTIEIPFRTNIKLTQKLLEEATGKEISLIDKMPNVEKENLYSLPSDSLYKRMMHESDNFLAEQLLVVASSTLSDTLNSERTREHILKNQLSDLTQEPRWVDGSGLSRYNLFSPESIVHVLNRMYTEIPRGRLFDLFPAGGISGTLENWYPGKSEPYVYAKTGSLGNNHCLSGYLVTQSGKTLIFSFMNNHFRHSSSEVKKRMQLILERIRDTY
ncbi:MAG: D-alanyl-D-alanine carboxypeptidase [Pricia sp.]|nr:D-alanyl-D-alanine carboxypeptidase [Pricia sp.]